MRRVALLPALAGLLIVDAALGCATLPTPTSSPSFFPTSTLPPSLTPAAGATLRATAQAPLVIVSPTPPGATGTPIAATVAPNATAVVVVTPTPAR